ncbi:MAG TPA: endopeptidase La [Candidatus Egerieimonas intestinavium]|uniref:Lon protease n=1 Tax=Candidatus Egerieimonas intestinavium TaxID=2840777 RepID=A0A9D1JF02_9FIRM|nr:endopeptidase La [Candidatus Egerieimonas intestinavium]
MNNLRKVLPAMALRATTILPDMIVHFDINRSKSVRAMEEAVQEEQDIFLVTQLDPQVEDPGADQLYAMGCIARVKQIVKLPKGMMRILVEGLERAELVRLTDQEEYLEAEVEIPENSGESLPANVQEAMLRSLKEIFLAYCQENPKVSRELSAQFLGLEDVERLVDQISINLPLEYEQRQKLLEASDLSERYELLGSILANETEIFQIRADIQRKVQERVDKGQREYILREQLKLIREELGDDTSMLDADKFAEAVEKLQASQEVKDKIREEIRRFKNVGYNSSESAVIRGYIETLLSLPWDKESQDNEDLKRAREILDQDHYGLKKVKERVLEYLAVRTLTGKGQGPILCLVGPPGTGKTSIARSIARALEKKYVRICLGGVRDEAEIRGHRRTYVGAMAGRLVQGLQQVKVKNPLMLLDEIDKVSSDYKGDTSSALLEVLDSEQNSHFVDHYVEIPLDLSQVLFIATANDLGTIPRPLLDRMEIIEVSSYTENEKEHIAQEHLIPKQMEANGLKKGQLIIRREALQQVISGYTREAGVRTLERRIGEICRKAARKVLEEDRKRVPVTEKNLEEFLGKIRYHFRKANTSDEVGIVRGLAWTSVGGDTLQIEVNLLPGKGEFQLTGQLGDVMKESARAGISYIRSVAERYGIKKEFFNKHDIHIHIPAGAVPKDGPSAGITMATAMLSAITGIPVRADLAMTGEITLRGRVLPIGGLKEKLLAAKKAGIHTVLVPDENRPDVEEIESEITEGLELVFVKQMDEVLEQALAERKETDGN